MSDFNITLFEACELLNRSKKSISRYIRRGLLHPDKVKSQQGTLEYRFTKADIEAFKALEALNADETRQDETGQPEQTGQSGQARQDTLKAENIKNKEVLDETGQDKPEETRPDRTRETGQDSEVITLLKETTGLLKEQLTKKDEQIKDLGGKIDQLIERDRETNILIGQLQSKVLMLEKPKKPINGEAEQTGQARQDTADQTGQDKPKPEKAGFWKRLFKSEL
jgi:Helix-turn-helix domain